MPRSKTHVCDPIESIIAEIRAGRMVIVTDDEDRENEGDLICAAEKITPEAQPGYKSLPASLPKRPRRASTATAVG